MNEFLETAKNLTPFIPLAKPIIDEFLKPKLKKIENWLNEKSLKNELFDHKLCENRFQDYLLKTIEKCSIIDTLIFPNQQINIENIYQPLTIINNESNSQKRIKIENFPISLFREYKRILISDSAGMGKSTLSKFICLQAIKEKQGIPIFLELRKITSSNTVIQELLKQLNTIDNIFDEKFILKLLKQGEFIIILDGFDEIANIEKTNVTQDIKEFIFNCHGNLFLLTSRPEGTLSSFGDFKITNINGLQQNEAFELLKKFDEISKTNISHSLIKVIKGVNNQVNEFLTNPFLVSLLFKTYSFKRDIPSRKSTFYNEVYTALYQDHDLSKDSYKRDKNSKLDIQYFRLVLRQFADYTAKKGEIEYDKQKAISYLSECKKKLSFLDFKENDFIEDLITTVPIFKLEGNNIKWSHKSLQDYFAAEYITFHPKKDEIINHLISKDVRKYQNIIDLVIELDPTLIRHYVLPKILKQFIIHFEQKEGFEDNSFEDISFRKILTFETNFWVCKTLNKGNNTADLDQDFQRANEYISIKYKVNPESFTIINSDYLVAQTSSNFAFFLQLLGNKGVLGKSLQIGQDHSKESLYEILPENPEPLEILLKNNRFNEPEFFDQLSKKLFSSYKTRANNMRNLFIPDITFCKDLLNKIETEIEDANTSNFLLEY